MKKTIRLPCFVLAGSIMALGCAAEEEKAMSVPLGESAITLPAPARGEAGSVEQALRQRRSIRRYEARPIVLADVAQLLWAAQGITEPRRGLRTAPSAGATYPLETYLVAGTVEGLEPGVYRYLPADHALERRAAGDLRSRLAEAALGQGSVAAAPASIVFAVVVERTARRYGERADRYVTLEVGHAAQNLALQAVSLRLGTVMIGAFHDDRVAQVLNLPDREKPLYIVPVGISVVPGAGL